MTENNTYYIFVGDDNGMFFEKEISCSEQELENYVEKMEKSWDWRSQSYTGFAHLDVAVFCDVYEDNSSDDDDLVFSGKILNRFDPSFDGSSVYDHDRGTRIENNYMWV